MEQFTPPKKEARALEALVEGVKDVRFLGFDGDDDERHFAILSNIEGKDMIWVAEDIFADPAGFYM
jgi:hypothetical protein